MLVKQFDSIFFHETGFIFHRKRATMLMIYKKVGYKQVSVSILDSTLTPVILFSVSFSELLFYEESYLLNKIVVDSHTETYTRRDLFIKILRIDISKYFIKFVDLHSFKYLIICNKVGETCNLPRVSKWCGRCYLFHMQYRIH